MVHFSVCQKGARDAGSRPGLAVCPATHAGLALVPDVDAARLDLKALALREAAADARGDAEATGFKEEDGVELGTNVAVKGLHGCHVHGG